MLPAANPNVESLAREVERLERENKTLNMRVQGVEVLGKVLQESQDENRKLRDEVSGLKQGLRESGVDVSQLSLHSSPASLQPSATRCFLSQCEDNSKSDPSLSHEPFEVVPKMPSLTLISHEFASEEKFSLSGPPALEFHIKDISNEVKAVKDQSEQLLEQANEMCRDILPTITNPRERQQLKQQIDLYCEKLSKRIHDVHTRETLLQGLEADEEDLKRKAMQMESEQVSHGKVVQELKIEVQEYTEELQDIHNQLKQYGEANKEDMSLSSMSSYGGTSLNTTSTGTGQGSSTPKIGQRRLDSEVPLRNASCATCSDLIKQVNKEVKLRKDVERQKEELLDVNHLWDEQYKKLKSDTSSQIKELQQQVDFYKTSEAQKKYEAVRNSYKKVIDDERCKKENALDDKRRLEEKVKELEEEVKKLSQQIKSQQLQPQASGLLHSLHSTPLCSLAAQQGESSDMVKEIEVLKEQLRIYADDFKCERQDRERMQGEKEKLEADLKEAKDRIAMLEEQLKMFEEDFKKEAQEKERLRRQLHADRETSTLKESRRLTQFSRQAQELAERQARMRALREEYEIEERRLRQEELDLRRQGSRVMALHPEAELRNTMQHYPTGQYPLRYDRGSMLARGPKTKFYGEDVVADSRGVGREVPDGPTQGHIFCPHCHRSFSDQNFKAFDEHLNKCVE